KLEIRSDKGKLSATVWNGPEPWPFTGAKFEKGTLTLRFEQYDGTLTAKAENGKLVGEYFRPYAKGVVHYPFVAARPKPEPPPLADGVNITGGTWIANTIVNGPFLYKLISEKQTVAESGEAEFKTVPKPSRENSITGILIPVSG